MLLSILLLWIADLRGFTVISVFCVQLIFPTNTYKEHSEIFQNLCSLCACLSAATLLLCCLSSARCFVSWHVTTNNGWNGVKPSAGICLTFFAATPHFATSRA